MTRQSRRGPRRENIPDCDLTNVAANGECGATTDNKFGQLIAGTTYDTALTRGVRRATVQLGSESQRRASSSSRASPRPRGYFRRWNGNFNAMR